MTLATVLSPVMLMLLQAPRRTSGWSGRGRRTRSWNFIGDPLVALLFAVLLAMYTFGTSVGFGPAELTKKIGDSLLPIAGVMLIVGAGGGFKQVLVDGGAGRAIGKLARRHEPDRLAAGLAGRGPDPAGHGLGDGGHRDRGRHRGSVGAGSRRPSWRWWCWRSGRFAVLLPCQRRRVLAGEGVLRAKCRTNHQDLVRDGNDDLRGGAWG